ncbi:MAG: SIR2 family protein [Magnetococcales bacterium]|nr:SIR2 family protein [Magnetococcales bacterium]
MNDDIKKSIQHGRIILFLGAGASHSSLSFNGENLPGGKQLTKLLLKEANIQDEGDDLPDAYAAACKTLGTSEVQKILTKIFVNCKPSKEYKIISKVAWRKIYTTNIDDALVSALKHDGSQQVVVRVHNDQASDKDPSFQRLEYSALNGYIDRLKEGIFFSRAEFGRGASTSNAQYIQLAADHHLHPFLYIGTELNEPLLYQAIEQHKSVYNNTSPVSYIISPGITQAKSITYENYNIKTIKGTLDDFTCWLDENIGDSCTPKVVRHYNDPTLFLVGDSQIRINNTFTLVKRAALPLNYTDGDTLKSKFYAGYKPTWDDVIHEVAPRLRCFTRLCEIINTPDSGDVVVVIGKSGSGKSTLLKQIAVYYSDQGRDVYYLRDLTTYLAHDIAEISSRAVRDFLVIIDRFDPYSREIEDVLKNGKINKGKIVCAEREQIWLNKYSHLFKEHNTTEFNIGDIDKEDAKRIHDKLLQYDAATNLRKLDEQQRIDTIYRKSQGQMLVGLLEATTGQGYREIIEREFANLGNDDQRRAMMLVGMATIHHISMDREMFFKYTHQLTFKSSPSQVLNSLRGVVIDQPEGLIARHPTYIEHLIDTKQYIRLAQEALHAILITMSRYGSPFLKVQNISSKNKELFKKCINHVFVKRVFGGPGKGARQLYEDLEKNLHSDGLYWLQYGLILRDSKKDDEALTALIKSVSAFDDNHPHATHALGLQYFLVALKKHRSSEIMVNIDEALKMLELSNTNREFKDYYPLITMAEGHVTCLIHANKNDEAKSKARDYLNKMVEINRRENTNQRFIVAVSRLTDYLYKGKQFPFSRE